MSRKKIFFFSYLDCFQQNLPREQLRIDRRNMSRGLKREATASNKYENTELRIGAKLWMVPPGAGFHRNSRGSDRVARHPWHMLIRLNLLTPRS